MNNGLNIGILLFTLTLMYLMFLFMTKLTSKKHFYGIMIDQKYKDLDELKALDQNFKKLLTLSYFFTIALSYVLILRISSDSIVLSVPILLFLVFETAIYIKTHTSAKNLKNKLKDNLEPSKIVAMVDTSVLSERNKIINKFKIYFAVNFIVIVIFTIYSIANYNSTLELIPIHWNFKGVADGFVENTFRNFLLQIGLLLFIVLILILMSILTMKSRIKIDTEDIDSSKKVTLKFLNYLGYSFLGLIISLSIIYINSVYSIINGTDINFYFYIISTVLMILSAILLIVQFVKSSNLKSSSSFTPDDKEENWLFGLIYYNKNDPSLMIPKRFGVGWTINAANPIGKIIYIGIALLLIYAVFDIVKGIKS
jgi:uncharacterized membrane protein